MQHLPNNCRAGKISVYPKNWKTVSANKNLIWRIWYRFYDDNLKKIRKVVIKGMNSIDDLIIKNILTWKCPGKRFFLFARFYAE